MKRKSQQIFALIAVFLLVALYLVTFLVACMDFPNSGRLFQACLVATIGLPILLWIYIKGYSALVKRIHPEPEESEEASDK
ncbi:MAG: hypothetical protein RR238_08020 [Lachnospiraceae bacterium]